jgi:hypothetical protein
MIVKIIAPRTTGTGRPLCAYVLGLRHEHDGQRLGAYMADPKNAEKIEWSRCCNINADSPAAAISAIEHYNAQNTRKHTVSRWEHIIVSFPDGEKPTREQMTIIEDRLMEAIGFGDHPRISAVHKAGVEQRTGNNWHLHIAVSRIDPTTLKAEHPRHNFFKLQAEAARLELDLSLRQERKNVLARERQELDARAILERGLNGHSSGGPAYTGGDSQMPTDDDPKQPLRFPSSVEQLSDTSLLRLLWRAVGRDPGSARTQEKADEHTILRLFDGDKTISAEHVKQAVDRSVARDSLNTNRSGGDRAFEKWEREAAEAARAEALHPPPNSFIERHAELRDSGMDKDQIDQTVRRDSRASPIAHRPGEHHKPTPRDALYARYKTEKTIALGARKEAEQAIYDRFAGYQQGIRSFYDLRREQEKLNARQPHRIDRQNAHELLRAQQQGDRVEANQLRAQQLAAARREHPLPTWEAFLTRESDRGDREAARILQQRRAREIQHGHEQGR